MSKNHVYKGSIISTIVDKLRIKFDVRVYKGSIISTIVDYYMNMGAQKRVYKGSIISTIVDSSGYCVACGCL